MRNHQPTAQARNTGVLLPAAALASGALFACALPPRDLSWLAWVAFAPLMVASARLRPLEAVGLAILCGLTCAFVLAGWSSDGGRLFWAYGPFFSCTLLVGLLSAGASIARRIMTGARWVLAVACLAVALEFGTTLLPIPFNLALTQYRNIDLIQLASVTGIWGVSLVVWLVNAAIADAVMARRPTPALAASAALVAIVLAGGALGRTSEGASAQRTLRVAAIQDFTGQDTEGLTAPSDSNAWKGGDREAMTRYAVRHGAQLVVWSEEDLGSDFHPSDPNDATRKLARADRTSFVVGYSSADQPKPYNCAAFVAPSGAVLGVYHKQHLYLGEAQGIRRGSGSPTFATPIGRAGMEICFDSCYTDVTRALAAHGAQFIAMPNYDPPTPRGVLHYLHATMIPFRAVENRVPFIRCDSNGVSMLVDPDGAIVAEAPLYHASVLAGTIGLGTGKGTLYTRLGDWLAYLCIVGVVWITIAGRRAKWESEMPKARPLDPASQAVS